MHIFDRFLHDDREKEIVDNDGFENEVTLVRVLGSEPSILTSVTSFSNPSLSTISLAWTSWRKRSKICKLRLFLKLVAQVDSADQIEPLPDIDFNIRAGNTLVGYASLEKVSKSQQQTLGFGTTEVRRIEYEADLAERAFKQFRAQQITQGGRTTHSDKEELRRRLERLLRNSTDLAGEYGVNLKRPEDLAAWKSTHRPFHWFVEFYGIVAAGGFM